MQPNFNPYFRLVVLCCAVFLLSCGNKQADATAQTASEPQTAPAQTFADIDVATFDKLRSQDGYVMIDVRTPEEIANGKIGDAMELNYTDGTFEAAIGDLDRSKQYLVYCKAGGRSARASKDLVDSGFSNVHNLLGGYDAWSEAHQ